MVSFAALLYLTSTAAVLLWIMTRHAFISACVFLASSLVGCGGGAGGGSVLPPPVPQDIPTLTTIAPSIAPVGGSALNLVLSGSNFKNGATVQWNGATLSSSWVSATQMTATIPASNFVSAGSAKVTVTNPSPGGGTSAAQTFTINAAPAATTWVRSMTGITTAQDIVWDAAHGKLYVSISPTDTAAPNTIIPINPVTAAAGAPVGAGNNPFPLSISSDASYLWVGLNGDSTVQRFLLPGLTKDISIPLPKDSSGNPEQAVSLEAARVNPHTVALVAGPFGTGNGVYIYDDAIQRPNSIPGRVAGGPGVDWIQWGASDSTIYGNSFGGGAVATLNVTSSGASVKSSSGGRIGPESQYTQYDKGNRRLYSTNRAFNPIDGSQIGQFAVPLGERVCTADSSLGRYYCVFANLNSGTDVSLFELWVYDLNSYALIDRVFFGPSAGTPVSSVTGALVRLIRWGSAGLALITNTGAHYGSGGLFLIDGAAVNPNVAPDVPAGVAPWHYSWIASLQPQQVTAGSGDVTITLKGTNFTQDSTACWNCNYLQFQFLPTTFVSSEQLNVTIPASLLAKPGQLPISVFDTSSNLFSSDSLSLLVTSATSPGSGTQINALGLAGLAMAWEPGSGLLYVGTAEYDGAYPNSIVALDGKTGGIVKTQTVGSNPDLLSVSASGQYLYVAYAGATTITQLQLPGLASPLTWALNNSQSSAVYWAGDIKAAPESPHTTAVILFDLTSSPSETGGVAVYDDNVERPNFVPGWGTTTLVFDTLAWGPSDQILTGALTSGFNGGPLSEFQISQLGASLLATGTAPFNKGELHSDIGTGLIYSDDGNVADPTTQAIVGSYNASGLVAPDSSLNRVFILGQTAAQGGTNNFTIESFDEKAHTLVSSITLQNLLGSPTEIVRWGTSGLAVLTMNQGGSGSQGMLYLVQDTTFVSNAQKAVSSLSMPQELVQRRWNASPRPTL